LRHRTAIILCCLLCLLMPHTAHAQEPLPPVAPPPVVVSWDSIPDLFFSVTFVVPQCSRDCNGTTSIIAIPAKPQFPAFTTNMFLLVFNLIGWLFDSISYNFGLTICWLMQMLQLGANAIITIANVVINGLNQVARLLFFAWITLRSWFYSVWYLAEVGRDTAWYIQRGVVVMWSYVAALIEVLALIIPLVVQIIIAFVQVIIRMIGIFSWMTNLFIGVIQNILVILYVPIGIETCTDCVQPLETVPTQLLSPAIIYSFIRGMLDGLWASQVSFILWLFVAAAHLSFITWFAKFFGGKQA